MLPRTFGGVNRFGMKSEFPSLIPPSCIECGYYCVCSSATTATTRRQALTAPYYGRQQNGNRGLLDRCNLQDDSIYLKLKHGGC